MRSSIENILTKMQDELAPIQLDRVIDITNVIEPDVLSVQSDGIRDGHRVPILEYHHIGISISIEKFDIIFNDRLEKNVSGFTDTKTLIRALCEKNTERQRDPQCIAIKSILKRIDDTVKWLGNWCIIERKIDDLRLQITIRPNNIHIGTLTKYAEEITTIGNFGITKPNEAIAVINEYLRTDDKNAETVETIICSTPTVSLEKSEETIPVNKVRTVLRDLLSQNTEQTGNFSNGWKEALTAAMNNLKLL